MDKFKKALLKDIIEILLILVPYGSSCKNVINKILTRLFKTESKITYIDLHAKKYF